MKIGDTLNFTLMDVKEPPTKEDNDATVIAFVPLQGFQWSKYANGSKTWQSIITMETIHPTSWLKLNR